MVKIVKELDNFNGNAVLIKIKDNEYIKSWDGKKLNTKYFAVSSTYVPFTDYGSETMIFACNKKGKVTSWSDIVCVRPSNQEEAIKQFTDKVKTT